MDQMVQTLNLSYLKLSRRQEKGRSEVGGGEGMMSEMISYFTMFPCKSRTSNFIRDCNPEIFLILKLLSMHTKP